MPQAPSSGTVVTWQVMRSEFSPFGTRRCMTVSESPSLRHGCHSVLKLRIPPPSLARLALGMLQRCHMAPLLPFLTLHITTVLKFPHAGMVGTPRAGTVPRCSSAGAVDNRNAIVVSELFPVRMLGTRLAISVKNLTYVHPLCRVSDVSTHDTDGTQHAILL